MSDKQCSDKAQTGPGLKPPVGGIRTERAPKTGAASYRPGVNSSQRGTDNKAK